MVKEKIQENSQEERISIDRKKTEETITTLTLLLDLALLVEVSKENKANLKKKLKIVKMTKWNTIPIISTRKPFQTEEKLNKWKEKSVRSKETEGDTALTILTKQERHRVTKMMSLMKMNQTTKRIEKTIEMMNLI